MTRYESWRVFATLTFKGAVPSETEAQRITYAHLYRSARVLSIPFRRLVWVLRQEHGEIGGRLHFHLLLGGVADGARRVTIGSCFVLNHLWKQLPRCGMAQHRLYQPELHGAEYIVKVLTERSTEGANAYELSKFLCDNASLTLSHSLGRSVAGKRVSGDREPFRTAGQNRLAKTPISCSWSNRKWSAEAFYAGVDALLADTASANTSLGRSPQGAHGLPGGQTGEFSTRRLASVPVGGLP